MRDIGHFIGGKEVKGGSGRTGDVFNPNTGEVQAKVAFASKSEVEQAIAQSQQILASPSVKLDADVGFFGKLALVPSAMKAMKNEDGRELRDVLPPGVAQLLFVERTSREGCVGLASIAVRVALTLRRSNGAARALKRNCGAR